MPILLFLSGPAIGADLFPVNTDRLQHSLKGLVGQRIKAELLADGVQQTLSAFAAAVGVFFQMLLPLVALQLLHHAARQQIHGAVAAREVQVTAGIHDGRTGRAHMHLRRAGAVQEFDRFTKLRAAHDGVVHKEEFLALDQLRHGDLLHARHFAAHLLILGHERARPGRGILDEGARKGLAALVCIAHGVRHAGIRHTGDEVNIGHAARFLVARHDRAVAIAHQLDVHAFVVGVRIAVIGPQEGADLHLLARR